MTAFALNIIVMRQALRFVSCSKCVQCAYAVSQRSVRQDATRLSCDTAGSHLIWYLHAVWSFPHPAPFCRQWTGCIASASGGPCMSSGACLALCWALCGHAHMALSPPSESGSCWNCPSQLALRLQCIAMRALPCALDALPVLASPSTASCLTVSRDAGTFVPTQLR